MIQQYKQEPKVRAYILYVHARWKHSGEIEHSRAKYMKRLPNEIQQMENVRTELHKDAFNFLKGKGFSENIIHRFLEEECELETKRELEDLKDGENYCGCCRVKVKTKEWEEHEGTELHQILLDKFGNLHKLYQRMKIMLMMDKANQKGGELK